MRTPRSGSTGPGGPGPRPRSPEQSRRGEPGYSQQEAHVDSGVGSGLGRRRGLGAAAGALAREEEKGEKDEAVEECSGGCSGRNLLGSASSNGRGAEVGSAQLESLEGRGRKGRRGKGRSPVPGELPPQCNPRSPPPKPPASPTLRTLARATRVHSGPRAAALGPPVVDTFATSGHKLKPPGGLRPGHSGQEGSGL